MNDCTTHNIVQHHQLLLPIGASISYICYGILLFLFRSKKFRFFRQHPTNLYLYKCCFEMVFVSQFFWIPFVSSDFFWDEKCERANPQVWPLCFLTEYSLVGGELWYLVFSHDIYNTIKNPFLSTSKQKRRYMMFVFVSAFIPSMILALLGPKVYGLSSDPLIWIQDNTVISEYFNPAKDFLFFIWLFFIFAFSFYVIFYVQRRLNKGLELSLTPRIKSINRMLFFRLRDTVGYTTFWCLVGILQVISFSANKSQNGGVQSSFHSSIAFVLASRGLWTFAIVISGHWEELMESLRSNKVYRRASELFRGSAILALPRDTAVSAAAGGVGGGVSTAGDNLNSGFGRESFLGRMSIKTADARGTVGESSVDREEKSLHLQEQLRKEVLYFTTQGIRIAVFEQRLERECGKRSMGSITSRSTRASLRSAVSEDVYSFGFREFHNFVDQQLQFRLSDDPEDEDFGNPYFAATQQHQPFAPPSSYAASCDSSEASSGATKLRNKKAEGKLFKRTQKLLREQLLSNSDNEALETDNPIRRTGQSAASQSTGGDIESGALRNTDMGGSDTDDRSSQKTGEAAPRPSLLGPGGTISGFSLRRRSLQSAEKLRQVWSSLANRAKTSAMSAPAYNTMHDFSFNDYSPGLFQQIRELSGVNDEDYIEAFTATTRENFSEGRSGSFLYFSANEQFIVKTIKQSELNTLIGILPAYVEHLRANPKSLIARFMSAHAIVMYETTMYFMVMRNIFANVKLSERYDLKGSWEERSFKAAKSKRISDIDDNEEADNLASDETMGLLLGGGGSGKHHVDSLGGDKATAKKVPLYKDNDLRHRITLMPSVAIEIASIIRHDILFLRSCNLMDYSLLIGIESRKYKIVDSSAAPFDGSHSHSFNLEHFVAPLGEGEMVSPATAHAKGNDSSASSGPTNTGSAIHAGIVEGPGTYYFGIIDILEDWNWRKRAERFIKVYFRRFDPNGVSTMPPVPYAKRFWNRAVRDVFEYIEGVTSRHLDRDFSPERVAAARRLKREVSTGAAAAALVRLSEAAAREEGTRRALSAVEEGEEGSSERSSRTAQSQSLALSASATSMSALSLSYVSSEPPPSASSSFSAVSQLFSGSEQ